MASKTYRTSAGITLGGLRIAVAVHSYPTRKVTIKVGDFTAYTADWNEQSQATATGIIASMLGEGELDHCKYLTQALVEVELCARCG